MVDIAKPHSPAVTGTTESRTRPTRPAADPARLRANGRAAPAGPVTDPPGAAAARYLLAGIRIALGFIFLWAFLDKVFGLGFSTPSAKAWINGGNPSQGFLASSKARSVPSSTPSPGPVLPTSCSWAACWPSGQR